MMGDNVKQVSIGADSDSESAEGFAPAAGLKKWVTPKVITSTMDSTKVAPGIGTDASNHSGNFSS